jgi:UDP-N-acetylglucosamine--N-acetylmuramyl-(pentapeptide) pyrophosphoryl-undecaprenol N-acetylglucosamine transferase
MSTALRKLRVLHYAINGIGIGHVMRLRAIARSMQKLAPELGFELEPFFVTSTEAPTLLAMGDLPVFKVPSAAVLRQNGSAQERVRLAARDCVWSIIERMKPHLLLMDTVPTGSFDEFMPFPGINAFDLCARKVFIYRPVKLTDANAIKFSTVLPQYDLILVPENLGAAEEVVVPECIKRSVEWCGPVLSYDHSDLLDREAALLSLGVQKRGVHVYLSAGGGGHRDAQTMIGTVCELLGDRLDLQLLVGAGPLYRGSKPKRANVVWLNTVEMASHLAAVDIAISAGGYNSFNELMFAGIPTIFVPLDAAVDDQRRRASRAESVGAGVVISGLHDKKLLATIELWRDGNQRAKASAAAKALVPQNCAKIVARRTLELFL